MPIHGLTRTDGHLPRLGELRKGAAKGANRPGRDQDYFRFTAVDEPELEQQFTAVFGPEPRKIPCFLPYQYPDECFEAWNYTFRASGIQVKCDGLQVCAQRADNGQLIHYSNESAPPCMGKTGCYTDGQGKVHTCDPRGMLHIVIPSLQRYGTVTVLTGSKVDISNISGTLVHLYQMAQRYDMSLSDIPMQLTRHKQKQSKPMPNGTRRRVPTSLLRIEPLPEWVSSRMIAATSQGKQIPMNPEQEVRLALPGRSDEVVEDVEATMLPEATYVPDVEIPTSANDVPLVTVGEDEVLPVEEPVNHNQLTPRDVSINYMNELGLVGEHEGKWRMVVSLILGRPVADWESVKDEDYGRLQDGLRLMERTLPSIQDNIAFVQEIKERFQLGAYTLDKWDFEKGLSDWMKLNYPPEPEPKELAEAVPKDDLPF